MEKLYWYKANVTSVYDGDTVTCEIDLGFGISTKNQKIRLYGINTPEVRGDEREEGLKVRDIVRNMILGKDVFLQTIKDKKGKFGRWLARIHIGDICLNDYLLENGFATPY